MDRAMVAERKKLIKESVLKAVASNDFETLEEDTHNAEMQAAALDPAPMMGASWSQFIMIMGLLFSNQCCKYSAPFNGVNIWGYMLFVSQHVFQQ
jgi:hypothetical protein